MLFSLGEQVSRPERAEPAPARDTALTTDTVGLGHIVRAPAATSTRSESSVTPLLSVHVPLCNGFEPFDERRISHLGFGEHAVPAFLVFEHDPAVVAECVKFVDSVFER